MCTITYQELNFRFNILMNPLQRIIVGGLLAGGSFFIAGSLELFLTVSFSDLT